MQKEKNIFSDKKLYNYNSYEEMIMGQFNETSKEEDKSLKLSRKIYNILYPYKSSILEKKKKIPKSGNYKKNNTN